MTTPQETIARILDRWQLDALTAAGFAVVPVEPTEEMIDAFIAEFQATMLDSNLENSAERIYRAMLRAASIAASGEGK